MHRRLLKEILLLMALLLPIAGADYYYSPYSHYGGGGGAQPMVSLNFDPQENLNNGFRLAAREDRLDEVEHYLHEGAQVNSVSDQGKTALMWAARECSTKLVAALLEAKADVNIQDKQGRTALMLAAQDDCVVVVDQLTFMPGIQVELKDKQGLSAYDYAGAAFQITDRLHAVASRAHHHKHRAQL